MAAKGSLAKNPLYRSLSSRERQLCSEAADMIAHFVDGDVEFAALRLAKRFGSVEAILGATETELLAAVPDEPRLTRALARSRYFSALRLA